VTEQDVLDEAVLAQIQAQAQAAQQAAGQQRVSEEELQGANPLMMMLRSLLPWVDAGQAPEYGGEGGGEGGEGGGAGGGAGGGGQQ